MLNRNQKRFKRQMELIQKEQNKQQDVYSYIHDKDVKGYYSNNHVKPSLFLKFLRIVMYLIITIIAFFGVVLVATNEQQRTFMLLFTLFVICIVLMFFGLINPSLVIFGINKSRTRVITYYGLLLIVFFTFIISISPTNKIVTTNGNKTILIASKKESPDQFKKSAILINYLDLARNPDKYISKRVKYTGEVIQTLESNNYVALRINVSKDKYGTWNDTIFVNYYRKNGESRILEKDIITLWGTVKGLKTYNSILGSEVTIPEIDGKYINIVGHDN